ncbi:methyltransferase family protein [Candidatus Latescibacterota bacterium]
MGNDRKWYIKSVIKGVVSLPLIFAFFMALAGRKDYWQGWVFCGICFVGAVAQFAAFSGKTELGKERMKHGPGTKWWDKVILAFFGPLFFTVFILAILDAGRFGWTSRLHWSVYVIGYIAHIISYAMTIWSMWVNSFFSSTVRIQSDRGQIVVRDGPYRYVRHPGYVGGILLAVSSSLILGSLTALIPAGGVVVLLILRTYLEDKTLKNELEGYSEYAETVRYRLLPGIW